MDKIKTFLKKYISDITYGATDGVITTFVIVAGASGAKLPNVAIVIGLSSLLADSVSMGSSRYLSLRSELAINQASDSFVKPFSHALVTVFAFLILGSIPLLSFVLPLYLCNNFILSCILSGIALFTVGSIRGIATRKIFLISGTETLLVGLSAALIGFYLGNLFSQRF